VPVWVNQSTLEAVRCALWGETGHRLGAKKRPFWFNGEPFGISQAPPEWSLAPERFKKTPKTQ